ncbi:hypothetical protein ES705_11583 [subsurface metagenome]
MELTLQIRTSLLLLIIVLSRISIMVYGYKMSQTLKYIIILLMRLMALQEGQVGLENMVVLVRVYILLAPQIIV